MSTYVGSGDQLCLQSCLDIIVGATGAHSHSHLSLSPTPGLYNHPASLLLSLQTPFYFWPFIFLFGGLAQFLTSMWAFAGE
jgi:hypothetical protein